jgi:hypothetical protein
MLPLNVVVLAARLLLLSCLACYENVNTVRYSEMLAVAYWLRHCVTGRKVAGSRPDEVSEFFQLT